MVNSFARELRLQCARKGSIAQICKATGINRQQFNKYLAGQILPGARTMRKICAYLGVSEAQLMSGETPDPDDVAASPAIDSGRTFSSPLPPAAPAVPGQDRLQSGFYRGYFPVHGHGNLVARWLIQVRDEPGGAQSHSCRNYIPGGTALGYVSDRLRYQGPVRYGPAEACLIGTAHVPQPMHGIIFVNLQPVAGSDCFAAMVLTRRAGGPVAISGALQFLGPACSAREALAHRGVVALDGGAIDPIIVRIMRAASAAGPSWIQSVNERNLQAEAASGGSLLPEALLVRRLSV